MFPHQREIGTVKFAKLDALNQQHFTNMFERLCRGQGNTTTISRQSLPTLLGSIGLISPQDSRFLRARKKNDFPTNNNIPSQQQQQDDDDDDPEDPFAKFGKQQQEQEETTQQQQLLAAVAAAAASALDDPYCLTLKEAIEAYDEAVDYIGKSLAECMEFFAILDEDGDGVVDVGALRDALCGPKKQQQQQQQKTNKKSGSGISGGISEAEFYYALDAAKLLTGPSIALSNFDEASGSRLEMLKVDDDLRDEAGEENNLVPPPTSPDAHLTGTVVSGGLTVYQFCNVLLKFSL